MSLDDYREKNRERDDFWDIDKLVPRRSSRLSPFATVSAVRTHEVSAGEDGTVARGEDERRLTFADGKGVRDSEDTTYYPDGAGLIKRVTIKRFIDKYDFYDNFRKAALVYFDYKADKCDFVQFYSYMPQYSQLTPSQKNYYFYWRSELRRGKYLKTDYSYLYLYVYEILNLPDKIPPEEGIKLLCRVWREYRSALPRIDLYLSIWVQDYCLVHSLRCPTSEVHDFIFDCIASSSFKEFYLADINEVGISGIGPLLAYLSDYDWRRGKFAGADLACGNASTVTSSKSYKHHMQSAMYLLLSEVWNTKILGDASNTSIITRDAFPNSLCTHTVKCKLEIEYVSLAGADDVRRGVSAAVRYTENKLRALLGVKSRLAVRDLPDDYRVIIDRYFDTLFKVEQRRKAEAQRPEYERMYEVPREKLSFDGADEIERTSWQTTARLVDTEEFKDTIYASVETPGQAGDRQAVEVCDGEDCYGLDISDIAYLAYAYGEEFATREYSLPAGTPEEALAERINEAFAENFGDVILEQSNDGFTVIDDYRKDIKEWLLKRLK